MSSGRDTKYVVQLFECALLGLVQEEEDHPEGNEVHGCVETECTLDSEGFKLSREGNGDHGGPEVIGCYCPGHTYFTMRQREDFCGVSEGDWTFTRRVEGVVDVDEESHHTEMGATALRDPVAHPRQEKTPTHVRERKQEQGSTAECINGPNGREGEDEIDKTKAERREESDYIVCARLDEDRRRVEGDDVDYES